MLSLHLNASLKSYPLLQTLMIEHATYLCVRSSHEAIHYASALVSVAAPAASCFFCHRKQEQEVSLRESHRTGRSPKIVGADVQTLDGQRRDSRIPLPIISYKL